MITKINPSDRKPLNEGTTEYDCDFRPFKQIVEQLNEMGAPITLYDLMELIEGKLIGTLISGTQDPYLVYTLVVNNSEHENYLKRGVTWSQNKYANKEIKTGVK